MFISTHFKIANYFYRCLTKAHRIQGYSNQSLSFKLDPVAFAYGSIKPDITNLTFVKHHFHETYHIYLEHLRISQDDFYTNRQRSVALGVAVHFLCDYFCKYHAKAPYKEYDAFKHLIYECQLHINISNFFWRRTISGNHHLLDTNNYTNKNRVPDDVRQSIEQTVAKIPIHKHGYEEQVLDLEDMVLVYYTKEDSLALDRDFALTAVNDLLEIILGVRALEIEEGYEKTKRRIVNENSNIYGYFSTSSERRDQYVKKIG